MAKEEAVEYMYVDLKVLNWEKFHPNTSTKKHFYFKCDASMVDGPNFAGWTAEEFKSWIYILSMCARSKSAEVRVNLVHVRRNSAIRTRNFVNALKKLQLIRAIDVKNEEIFAPRVEKSRGEESKVDLSQNSKRDKSRLRREPASRTPPNNDTALELIPSGEAGGGTDVSRSIGEFVSRWSSKHGGKYPLTGKDTGLIKSLVKSLGEKRLVEILEAYFVMPDAWIVGRKHDVTTLNANLSKIAAFADTGEFITQTQVQQLDRTATAASQIERIKRGEV